ncbi:hypothetical protein CMZ84_14020 [Lysobacteraceae bacterium NML93-0399]|nr:hypothetical protein CMZ84_14020 [Xanthomonadaceae bacterium NML93-0399]
MILVPALRRSGFEATGVPNALALYREMVATRFDLILLDVGLPDEDGFAIAQHLRLALPRMGLVMLTGFVSDQDRLRGLEAGVDAYLGKPVDVATVIATLRNLARRLEFDPPEAPSQTWTFDEPGWRFVSPGGRALDLGSSERTFLAELTKRPGTPVEREVLIAALGEDSDAFDPHRLEMIVHRLRKKCLQETGQELPVRTVRGVGYLLAR